MNAKHPLLGMTPAARRQLARTLLAGLGDWRAAERTRHAREALPAALLCAVLGVAVFAVAMPITQAPVAAIALWYGLWLLVQAFVGARLAPTSLPAPLALGLLAPARVGAALGAWLRPPRFTPDRLVLSAGLLVAVRRPVSYHLVVRLYGRAYPQSEVVQAIALLEAMGYLQHAPAEAPEAIALTRAGAGLLRELGVSEPAPRPRQDPVVAAHLLPLFAALEHAGRLKDEPVRAPELPFRPEPASAPEDEEEEEDAAIARPRAGFKRQAAIAALVVAVALVSLRVFVPFGPAPLGPIAAAALPQSQGTLLQFNARGFMVSSFAGGLFLSVPDRLDYKRPLAFTGLDMPSDCGLLHRPLTQASLSPHGRFLLAQMGGDGGSPLERCLVDWETRTVTDGLAAKNPHFALPNVWGWADESHLLLADATQRSPDVAWLMDVTTQRDERVALPAHTRVLPMPADSGFLCLGLDARQLGGWDLTTYWLDPHGALQPLRTIHTALPDAVKEDAPLQAAISPDKRYVLLGLRPAAGGDDALVVVSLQTGTARAVSAAPGVCADAPIFWGPQVVDGRYRFYFNGGSGRDVPFSGAFSRPS